MAALPPFDPRRFDDIRHRAGLRLGAPLRAVTETVSTNDDAAEAARQGAPEGALFVAEAQTGGRGRRGHTWVSPPSENLTFSLVLRPSVPPERVSASTLVVGAALRAALAPIVSEPVGIKWPNDVWVRERKLAGILVESQLTGSRVDAVIVGVGLNVAMRALPAEIDAIATSLSLLDAREFGREALLVRILAELEPRLEAFTARGLEAVLHEVRAADTLRDRPVRIGDVTGVGAGIGDDGGLLVRDESGAVRSVTTGTVEL
jgi:BirA family transcriptional regulator, biotin operon repressor / biotin---[acetyl-CoA-carboxylase] ligase